MKTLLLRELRRLAPYGVGCAALALLVIAWSRAQHTGHDLELIALLAIPCLLGAAAVAPDTSSGGTAFLARLPLTNRRVFLAKLIAGAAWSALGVALAMSLTSEHQRGTIEIAVFTYAAGVFASVLVARTMPALLLAPIFGLAIALLGGLVVILPNRVFPDEWVMLPFGGVVAACAGLAFVRGDRHRSSGRPAAIAFGSLALALALGAGSSAFGIAATEGRTDDLLLTNYSTTRSLDGKLMTVTLYASRWYGREEKVAVLDTATERAWVVPRRQVRGSWLSPSGRSLVIEDGGIGGDAWLVDLESRAIRPVRYWDFRFPVADRTEFLWRGERPMAAAVVPGSVVVRDLLAGGEKTIATPSGASIGVAAKRGEIVLLVDGSVVLLDPTTGKSTRAAAWPAGASFETASVSPSGEHVFFGGLCGFALIDLASGKTVKLACPSIKEEEWHELGLQHHYPEFAPGEKRLGLELNNGVAAFFDVETGRVLALAKDRRGPGIFWSPDGSLVADGMGDTLSIDTGEVRRNEWRKLPAALLGPDRHLPSSGPFRIASLATGETLARPLEVSR